MDKEKRPRKLKNGDYFFEIVLRAGVRKEDLPAVFASAEPWDDDQTDEERLLSAVLDVAGRAFEGSDKIDFKTATAGPIDTFRDFENIRGMGDFARKFKRKKRNFKIDSPFYSKKNKGKKISLQTADRLFAGFKERLSRVADCKQFGVDVSMVLLFGSYLRREPEVGDIDLAALTTHRSNYDQRAEQLWQAGQCRNIIEEADAPHLEVLKFLKNRSGWFSLHEVDELRRLKDLQFAIVHFAPALKQLAEEYNNKLITGPQFLTHCEEIRRADLIRSA